MVADGGELRGCPLRLNYRYQHPVPKNITLGREAACTKVDYDLMVLESGLGCHDEIKKMGKKRDEIQTEGKVISTQKGHEKIRAGPIGRISVCSPRVLIDHRTAIKEA